MMRFVLFLAVNLPMVASMSCRFPEPLPMNTTLATDGAIVFRGTVIREVVVPAPRQLQETTDANLVAPTAAPEADAIPMVIAMPERPVSVPPKPYVVQLNKLYKGCTIKTGERIVLLAGGTCGIPLLVNRTYAIVLSPEVSPLQPVNAATKAVLGNRTVVTRQASSGAYQALWESLDGADATALRKYRNVCA